FGGSTVAREEDLKSGPLADLALDFNPPLVLFDNAIDGGEAQAGSLAELLGGKEGLEDPPQILGWDATAGVADAETDEGAGPCFGVFWQPTGTHLENGDLDRQHAPLGH